MEGTENFQSVTADFTEAGDMTMVFKTEEELPANMGLLKVELTLLGSFEQKGEAMTLMAKDIQVQFHDLPEALKSQEEKILKAFEEENKQKMIDDINNSKDTKIVWVSESSFTMDSDGGPVTFTKA